SLALPEHWSCRRGAVLRPSSTSVVGSRYQITNDGSRRRLARCTGDRVLLESRALPWAEPASVEAVQQVADARRQVATCALVGQPRNAVGEAGEPFAQARDGRQAQGPVLDFGGDAIELAGDVLAVDAVGYGRQRMDVGIVRMRRQHAGDDRRQGCDLFLAIPD